MSVSKKLNELEGAEFFLGLFLVALIAIPFFILGLAILMGISAAGI